MNPPLPAGNGGSWGFGYPDRGQAMPRNDSSASTTTTTPIR